MPNLIHSLTLMAPAFFLSFALGAHAENTWELVDATNDARQNEGLPRLKVDDRLMRSAATHAADMAQRNYFSHNTPEGWGSQLRIFGWGYPYFARVGENIAAGQPNAWEVVQAWLASAGHRANLLNPSFRSMGAGHYYNQNSNYTNYWVGHYGSD